MNIKDLQPGSYSLVSQGTGPTLKDVPAPQVQAPQKQEDAGVPILGDIARPFARLGLNVANAGIGLFNPDLAKKIDQEGVDLPVVGHTTEVGTTGQGFGRDLADTVGTGAEVAADVLPVGGAGNLARGGLGAALKTGAVGGAAAGTLFGVGTGLQDPNATASSVGLQGLTGGLAGGVGGAVLGPALAALAKLPLGAIGVRAFQRGGSDWEGFISKYPAAAKQIQEAAGAIPGTQANKLGSTVNAVTPEFKGKGLVQAYKDVVTGSRDLQTGGIVKPQGVGSSPREVDVGKRLFQPITEADLPGVTLKNKPAQDIQTLRTAFRTTEDKLDSALKNASGDPEVQYNADKPTLLTTLNSLKTQIPEQFKAIKDEGSVFKRVVDFGKNVVNKTEDSIKGIRDARKAFDAQSKIEFPSAFKEGEIDVSTPAGRAIKLVRDSINDHLYDTAPNGSALQKLIGREADIFRATDAIAPRAAKGEGKSLLTKGLNTVRNHPYIVAGLAANEVARHTVFPDLPGI